MSKREDSYLEPHVLRPTITSADYNGEPPPPQLVYEMQTPEAKQAADLLAVQRDLEFVWESLDMVQDLPRDRRDFTLVVTRALWTAALITYARCFGKGGKRTKLTEDDVLRTPNGEQSLRFHRDMIKIRDKHIAHSVNGMETIKIGAMVGRLRPTDDEDVTGMAAIYSIETAVNDETMAKLADLANELLNTAMARAEEMAPAVYESARAAGVDVVKTWPEVIYQRGPVDPGVPRS
ncbi:hypothetical protein EXE59_02985 [Nocardioides eburneiflavus]|uniref:Uncharacterized protein n=1 Tax=Nocardioides eburneiflavus TaxID=2518372 RepID=A0A4Z1C2J7_9ACTN|nr:hypothetical protein [Nocardioides eburneiflavus]TGN63022.1 hypothetical protein EXE59_02985 [Nocardioides eburneiflavus]